MLLPKDCPIPVECLVLGLENEFNSNHSCLTVHKQRELNNSMKITQSQGHMKYSIIVLLCLGGVMVEWCDDIAGAEQKLTFFEGHLTYTT